MTVDHVVHGLRIRSEVPLPEQPRELDDVDLHVRLGAPREVPADPPAGEVVAEMVEGDRRLYTAATDGGDVVLRFHGTCEIVISRTLDEATCHVDPAADPALLSVLVSGTMIALVMELMGELVLHASAVEVDGAAIAVVGTSGMGKSTVSALLCHAGAALVTDDVLRVRPGRPPRCLRGASALRLRQSAATVVEMYADPEVAETADQRLGLQPTPTSLDDMRLGVLVVPRPMPDISAVSIERLAPSEALVALGRYPRVYGMRRAVDVRRHFRQRAELVDAIPVLVADIPWGPPFRADVAVELREALVAHLAVSA